MPTIYQIIIVALAATFTMLFITKTGARETFRDFCDTKKLYIVAEMLNCDFCLGFWTNLFVAIILATVMQDTSYLIVPLFSSPITRFLI